MYFYIFIPFSVITAFLIMILIFKKNKDSSDVILAAWFLAGIFHATVYYLYISGLSFTHTAFLSLDLPVTLVHGPFLYMYVCLLTKKNAAVRLSALVHFIPALALYAYQIPFFVMSPSDKIRYIREIESVPDVYSRIKFFLIIASGIFYIAKSSLLFLEYKKRVDKDACCADKINPRWILVVIIQTCLIFLCILFLDVTMPARIHTIGTFLTVITGIYFIVFLAHYGLTRSNIYILPSYPSEPDVNGRRRSRKNDPAVRYRKSGLKESSAAEIEHKISAFIKKSKPYLDSDITLYSFAGKIGVNPNHLSQVINERMHSSFWDLINRCRIEEFKSRVGEIGDKEETILSLAFFCGFNSKSSFNTVFKKFEGVSPRAYIAKQKKP